MTEQRKRQRFELKFPIEVVRTGNDVFPQVGETRNLSSSGILFTADSRLNKGEPIEFMVTISSQPDTPAVKIRCLGKVVRVEERKSREKEPVRFPYAIAATLERHEFLRK